MVAVPSIVSIGTNGELTIGRYMSPALYFPAAEGDPEITADFDWIVYRGDNDFLTVDFFDRSTCTQFEDECSVNGWDWDFDGDGNSDSFDPNPRYTFPAAGTYSVTLTTSLTYVFLTGDRSTV